MAKPEPTDRLARARHLRTLRRLRRDQVDAQRLAAMLALRELGVTFAAIADAAGVTESAVIQQVHKAQRAAEAAG